MRWRPYPITLFDCDSTLSAVEGIDELADSPEKQEAVANLTEAAMDGSVPLEEVYGERLSLLKPSRADIRGVKAQYKAHAVPDAKAVIAALTSAGAEPWIISGGLNEPVAEFATWLGVEPDRVCAVGAEFDPFAGDWWHGQSDPTYAEHDGGHLTTSSGKADVIKSTVAGSGRRLLVGDGASDLAARTAVDLFVGYAGVVAREAVISEARVVITSKSIAPVLALALGPERVDEMLVGPHADVAKTCLAEIEAGALRFNDEELAERFAS